LLFPQIKYWGAMWLSRKGDIKGYKIRRTRALKDIQSQSRPCD